MRNNNTTDVCFTNSINRIFLKSNPCACENTFSFFSTSISSKLVIHDDGLVREISLALKMSVNNALFNLKWVFLIFLSILMARPALTMIATHIKCRGGLYPRSNVERFPVPDEKVSWSVEYKNYKPANHTAPSIHGKPWADPEIGKSITIVSAQNFGVL